jgi:hypothetical protein
LSKCLVAILFLCGTQALAVKNGFINIGLPVVKGYGSLDPVVVVRTNSHGRHRLKEQWSKWPRKHPWFDWICIFLAFKDRCVPILCLAKLWSWLENFLALWNLHNKSRSEFTPWSKYSKPKSMYNFIIWTQCRYCFPWL